MVVLEETTIPASLRLVSSAFTNLVKVGVRAVTEQKIHLSPASISRVEWLDLDQPKEIRHITIKMIAQIYCH
jgi:hypothetical protein